MERKTVAQIYKDETGLDAMWRSAGAEDHNLAVYIEAPTQAYFSWLEKRAAENQGVSALHTANTGSPKLCRSCIKMYACVRSADTVTECSDFIWTAA